MSKKDTEHHADISAQEPHDLTNQEDLEIPASEAQDTDANAAIAEKFEALRAKFEAAQAQAEEATDASLRAKAELENYRRRADQEIEKAHKYALDRFVKALLPVIDTMERALEVESEVAEVQNMKEGVALTEKMFVDCVAKFGVEQLNPVGDAFNADFHEAMSMAPNPDMADNTIMHVVQKGYLLNGRVVRPARVIVVKNS